MNIIDKIDKQKLILAGFLITIGVLGRILLHDFFNGIFNPIMTTGYQAPLDVFFIVAAVSIFSGIILGKYYTFIVPVCVIVITDAFYAIVDPLTVSHWTAYIFLFTWSGYAFIALLGLFTKKKSQINKTFIPRILGAGVLGIIIYDLWTNFGFWLSFSKMGFYPQNLEGLSTVMYGGIPTMIWHLISASIAIMAVTIPLIYLKKHDLIKHEIMIKPVDRYVIASTTLILMIASILSAII